MAFFAGTVKLLELVLPNLNIRHQGTFDRAFFGGDCTWYQVVSDAAFTFGICLHVATRHGYGCTFKWNIKSLDKPTASHLISSLMGILSGVYDE